jgi:holliday junction DNA helicase RuvA
MIAYIRGMLTYIQSDTIIVDVEGVGYEIICPNPYAFQALENEKVFVYTYLHVREDAQLLYGFKTEEEKYLFTKLISVSGIGPKGALAIMASIDVAEFVAAIEREDEAFLKSFPGIGKKTARQIILDLKGKLALAVPSVQDGQVEEAGSTNQVTLKEAQEALKALGYTDREIKSVVPKLQSDSSLNTDELIRKALSLLMKK